jgi:hypothetical protein
VLTVTRTSSEPARHNSPTCFTVATTSAVSVLVIDCTATGASPPTSTWPIRTWRVARRGDGPNDHSARLPAMPGSCCLDAAMLMPIL